MKKFELMEQESEVIQCPKCRQDFWAEVEVQNAYKGIDSEKNL